MSRYVRQGIVYTKEIVRESTLEVPKRRVNANLLRRWVREAELRPPGIALDKPTARGMQAPEAKPLFVPVRLPPPVAAEQVADIRIELQRGATAITVTWPASAASECAAWMRELLR